MHCYRGLWILCDYYTSVFAVQIFVSRLFKGQNTMVHCQDTADEVAFVHVDTQTRERQKCLQCYCITNERVRTSLLSCLEDLNVMIVSISPPPVSRLHLLPALPPAAGDVPFSLQIARLYPQQESSCQSRRIFSILQ